VKLGLDVVCSRARTILEISAETFKLPIDMPDPAWLQTRFSTKAWWEGLLTETHSSRFVT
jgi:hypothetical protein